MKRRQTKTREGQEGNKTNIIGENFQGLHVPPPVHARTAVKRVQAYSTPSAAISNTNSHGQKERKSSQIHQRPRCNRRAPSSTTSLGERERARKNQFVHAPPRCPFSQATLLFYQTNQGRYWHKARVDNSDITGTVSQPKPAKPCLSVERKHRVKF